MNKSTDDKNTTNAQLAYDRMLYAVPFGGVDLFVNDFACISKEWKQYRYPKTKKKRIRRKWSKRSENFRMQDVHRMIVMKEERKVFVSQKMFDKLKERWNLKTNLST